MPAPGNPDRASHAARRKQHPLFIIPEVRPTLVSSFNGRSFPSDPCVPEGKGAAIFSRACRIPSFLHSPASAKKATKAAPQSTQALQAAQPSAHAGKAGHLAPFPFMEAICFIMAPILPLPDIILRISENS